MSDRPTANSLSVCCCAGMWCRVPSAQPYAAANSTLIRWARYLHTTLQLCALQPWQHHTAMRSPVQSLLTHTQCSTHTALLNPHPDSRRSCIQRRARACDWGATRPGRGEWLYAIYLCALRCPDYCRWYSESGGARIGSFPKWSPPRDAYVIATDK